MIVEENFAGTAGATFSDDRRHRLVLWRRWSDSRPIGFLMLNPSRAGLEDDPTVRRCVGFARREGAGGIVVGNLSPLIATDPRDLYTAILERSDFAFPREHAELRSGAFAPCSVVIAAWGTFGGASAVAVEALTATAIEAALDSYRTRRQALRCLGVTEKGWPRHPLYLAADTPILPWEPVRAGGDRG